MKKWMSAAEIAARSLPGIPTTKACVILKADRENWPRRPREGRGGGWEYPISSLPKSARSALLNRAVEHVSAAVPATIEATNTLPALPAKNTVALTGWQQDVMEARAAVLGWIDRNAAVFGKEPIIRKLTDLSKAGQLPEDLRNLVIRANAKSGRRSGAPKATLSARTLKYWFAEREKHGVAGLAPGIERSAEFEIPAWAPVLIDLWRNPAKPTLSDVLRRLPKRLPAEIAMPSYDQARRFLGKLSPVTANKGAARSPGAEEHEGLHPPGRERALADGGLFLGRSHFQGRRCSILSTASRSGPR